VIYFVEKNVGSKDKLEIKTIITRVPSSSRKEESVTLSLCYKAKIRKAAFTYAKGNKSYH